MATKEQLLAILRAFPVCTVVVLAILLWTSPPMVRRWLRSPEIRRLIRIRASITKRGRPVQLVSLRKYKGLAIEHESQNSTFNAQVTAACRLVPGLVLHHLGHIEIGGNRPDAAFIIESKTLRKAILLILEMDLASEPGQRNTPGTDIASKLHRYMRLRASNGHQALCSSVKLPVRGFRVLFVTPHATRSAAILRQANATNSGDFIWATDWQTLSHVGIHGNAWLSANRQVRRSIFGTLASQITKAMKHDENSNKHQRAA